MTAPATTLVVNRAAGPSTCSAATATASLAVEAGANPDWAWRDSSTRPEDKSATTAPTWLPRVGELSRRPSEAVTPAAVASGAAWPE